MADPLRQLGFARRHHGNGPRAVSRHPASLPHLNGRPTRAAYEVAVEVIASGPRISFAHPRPYPQLASIGFRWIKVHRYWFGHLPDQDPVITNILDEVADIPARVSGDQNPIDSA